MKRKTITILLLTAVMVCQAQIRMMITSDPHVMSKELFDVPYGEAFLKAMQKDLKVVENSQDLFDDFITKVKEEHPNILLVPGDLTKDGEKVSHEHVARQLAEVRRAGIKVYVIPGNHDMENPLGFRYRGDKAEQVPSISEREFTEIYREDGYAEAVMTDTTSHSYMVYPEEGLAIICINSIIPNRYKARFVHGRLSFKTLEWIERAARAARSEHRIVLAMIHHEIMQHHDGEDTFAPTAMLNMEKKLAGKTEPTLTEVRNAFRRSGIEVVITGHYHIQSIKTEATPFGDITDVTTGALSGFPSPYRYLTLDTKEGTLKVTSSTMFGNETSKWPDTELARKEFDRLRFMVQLYVPKIGEKTDMDEAYKYLAKSFDTALCALAAGDEEHHDPKAVIDECNKAFDDYVNHVYVYNTFKIDKLKAEKDSPYKRIKNLFTSIMYNYVGNPKNNTPDNDYTIRLKVKE